MKLSISVRPNSGRRELKKISSEEFRANLKSSPQDNKANIELLALLKKGFKAKEVKIISGKTSRKKLVEIKSE